jgi:ABC-type multidrug transport system ATPase subunit
MEARDSVAAAVSAPAVLAVRDVWKAYGRLQVLRGVELDVHRGEAVAVVGENGSGKSTLLKILAGLESADRGEISMTGRVGYCPQTLELFDGLTVAENLIYFGAAYGLSEPTLREQGRFYLERFRYAQFVDTPVSKLSGGTKQKLNLTLALLHAPDLLLLDEPYQGFDYESFLNFASMLGEWRAQGKAILTISHLVTADLGMDRILELHDGVLGAQTTPRSRL